MYCGDFSFQGFLSNRQREEENAGGEWKHWSTEDQQESQAHAGKCPVSTDN